MPSHDTVWIPAIAVSHVLGLILFLHALQQVNGALTYWWWKIKWILIYKRRFKGDFKMAWYWTFPGAKEAYDAQNAKASGADAGDPESAEQGDLVFLEDMPEPAELSWQDLSYRVKAGTPPKPKTVIHKNSGTFKPGDSVALMGPSGAGKSSLLDLLAGRKMGKGVKGSVTINGKQITAKTASQYTSYVAQEDVFVPILSVWEALMFYTQLSLPGDLSMSQRTSRMLSVLRTMGLEKVINSKVGGVLPGGLAVRGVSGGEKRRLSIACGLVANPSILFLDEPTTGLDSHAALAVMKHLISLTDMGLTVVASIHQPRQEIFESFHHVLIMSEGYQMFLAPPSYALHWFRNVMEFPYDMDVDGAVADWLITVVSVNFMNTKNSKRSLGSVEEVKQAALKFAALQEDAEVEGEERHQDIMETAQSLAAVSTEGRRSGQQYRSAMNSWVMSSLAGANLLRTKEMEAGGSADPGAPPLEDIYNTLDTLPEEDEPVVQRQYPRSWLVQYQVLFKRTFLGTLRNPAECAMRLLTNVWVAIFAGLIYIRLPDNATSASQRLASLFFLTFVQLMAPFSYMSFYISDRRFFIRDSANGLYAPSAYQLATITAGIPFVTLNTCAAVCTFYGLCGLRYEWQAILICMAILTLHTVVSQQFAIWAVWLTNSQDAAYTITSGYLTLNLLLCGFYIRVANMKLSVYKGITWAMFMKYTYQALAINELHDRVWDLASCNPNLRPVPLGGGAVTTCDTSGDLILRYYGFRLTVAICAGVLLGFWGLFYLMSYHALLSMYRKRK